MPKLTVDGQGSFEVPAGKRLANALLDEAGVDQLHVCGGFARCTTCRVDFSAGEPAQMTQAEKTVLTRKQLINTPGVRLSCQVVCDQDMTVKAPNRLSGSGLPTPGDRPKDEMTPPAVWTTRGEGSSPDHTSGR